MCIVRGLIDTISTSKNVLGRCANGASAVALAMPLVCFPIGVFKQEKGAAGIDSGDAIECLECNAAMPPRQEVKRGGKVGGVCGPDQTP
jgi:hypothetical protein